MPAAMLSWMMHGLGTGLCCRQWIGHCWQTVTVLDNFCTDSCQSLMHGLLKAVVFCHSTSSLASSVAAMEPADSFSLPCSSDCQCLMSDQPFQEVLLGHSSSSAASSGAQQASSSSLCSCRQPYPHSREGMAMATAGQSSFLCTWLLLQGTLTQQGKENRGTVCDVAGSFVCRNFQRRPARGWLLV